ncbi:SseB family protein [uncultured Ornithinimicrobium sp.]|uniref:SseB family protein n=1 Tax=uncultured Ornithinimicrobium sp. TaxID=259307 RepID=UPI0025950AB5|nr:SseB family protein [uncultured Ornithinimicrobium sp.]
MTHRFSSHDPLEGSDSAGVPWQGRTLTGTGFDQDDGTADEGLASLLQAHRRAGDGGGGPPLDPAELVAAVARARLIVPVVAVPGEIDDSSGVPVDTRSDMASVTLVAPDGARALPAFTSVAALTEWNADARPVPVTAQRAALAAVQEGCSVIPLDLPSPPGSAAYLLRPSMVWALAMGRTWVPAHEDDQVLRAVAAAVADQEAVVDHRCTAGPDGALQVELTLAPGLGQEEIRRLVTGVGERIAADGEARARIDAVAFRLGRT